MRRLAGICVLLLLAVTSLSPGSDLRPGPIDVTVDLVRAGPPVPADFLGLSVEMHDLPQISTSASGLATYLRMLGPGVLRLGGVSADTRTWWPDRRLTPRWAKTVLSAADFRDLGHMLRRIGWRALLTVNLAHFDPAGAAAEAAAARAALGRSLQGVSLGNEPDGYAYRSEHLRSAPWGFGPFRRQADLYLAAIRARSPGVELVGPETASPNDIAWITAAAAALHPRLLTAHYYPLNCASRPTFADLAGEEIQADEGVTLRRFGQVAIATRIPLRIDESNNISCGGVAGASDTFSSALWAVDYLTRAMSTPGISGVNLHDTLRCRGYSPLCLTADRPGARGGVRANPEFYGLLLARQLLNERPLPTSLGAHPPAVAARAFVNRDGLMHIVVTDQRTSGPPVTLRVHVTRRFRSATLLRLTGPSPQATDGVRLGGSSVGARGPWSPLRLLRIPARHGVISISVTPDSAALATVSAPSVHRVHRRPQGAHRPPHRTSRAPRGAHRPPLGRPARG